MNPDCAFRDSGNITGAFRDGAAVFAPENPKAAQREECVDAETVQEHSRGVCRVFQVQHEQSCAMCPAAAVRSGIFAVLMHKS